MVITYWLKGDTKPYTIKISLKKWIEKLPKLTFLERWETKEGEITGRGLYIGK